MPYNLESPNTLLEPIDPSNIERWFHRETIQIDKPVKAGQKRMARLAVSSLCVLLIR